MEADELRLVVPIRGRRRAGVPSNTFTPVVVKVPTNSTHPAPHFGVVAERLRNARKEPALPLAAGLASALSRLPTTLLTSALHAQTQAVHFVATALPGLRATSQVCGARIEESYPFGPRLGCPMNVTGYGNGNRLDVGITLSPLAFSEPDVLVDCLTEAFAGLVPTAP
jgi:hypothetical protein